MALKPQWPSVHLPDTPLSAGRRCLEGSWCLRCNLCKGVAIILPTPGPVLLDPKPETWEGCLLLRPHVPRSHLYPVPVQAQILSPPAEFLSCSSQDWPLPPQCPCAGLTGACPFSHFFSLIRLKSGSKLPRQMRQSELDQGTSRARLRHRRLWSQRRLWRLSQGRGVEGVSAVCALSAWSQHMG